MASLSAPKSPGLDQGSRAALAAEEERRNEAARRADEALYRGGAGDL